METDGRPESGVFAEFVDLIGGVPDLLTGELDLLDTAGDAFAIGPEAGVALILGAQVEGEADALVRIDGTAETDADIGLDGEGRAAQAGRAEFGDELTIPGLDQVAVHIEAHRIVVGGHSAHRAAGEAGRTQVGTHGEMEAFGG